MLYIIECEVFECRYMGETKDFKKTHLVDADSEDDAKEKLKSYYDKKGDPYYCYYIVNILDCCETIK